MFTKPKFAQISLGDLSLASLSRDALAGSISALVTIAYCFSFGALIFQGSISSGLTLGLAALLTGSAVTGLIVAMTTTLAPADAGPDTPAVAVMSVLAASIAGSFAARGLSGEAAAIHVLIAISVSTFLTGLMLLTMGITKVGEWLRFVPFPVIGGFLAASGWLLITGGIEVMTGVRPQLTGSAFSELFSDAQLPKLLVGLLFAIGVFALRQRIKSFFVLPATFFASLIVLDLTLLLFGEAGGSSWFLNDVGDFKLWLPLSVIVTEDIDWGVIAANSAEIGAVCGVTAISMLLDVSSLEVSRAKTAELDDEFRTNGYANIAASLVGGVAGNLSLNGSILIQEAGAVSRLSGVIAACICGLVLLIGGQIADFIPTVLLGGLLAYLGLVILTQAFVKTPALRSWTDFALAAGIMLIIINWGYLQGVITGIIGACLTFAFSYSRIGVVRRHLTRSDFSSNIERSTEQKLFLRENGKKIHVMWLAGFIFFGSSNGLFEYIRRCIDSQTDPRIRHIILDFSGVPGFDTSAMLSLVKLRNYCDAQGVALAISGISDKMLEAFRGADFFTDQGPHRLYGNRNVALEACENSLLSDFSMFDQSEDVFEDWLERGLGPDIDIHHIMDYLTRYEVEAGHSLYQQGEPSDSVDLIASGLVAIVANDGHGGHIQLRRMAGQTIVGEMGFYRAATRTASVIADEQTVFYSLTREAFEKMQADHPKSAAAFDKFIIRILADRLEFASLEIGALI